MHVVQQLARCETCSEILALRYRWLSQRLPSLTEDCVRLRFFNCPGCGHANPFMTVMDACSLHLKLIPGPVAGARARPSDVRRLLPSFENDAPEPRRPRLAGGPQPLPTLLRLQQLWPYVVWFLVRGTC